MSKTAQIRCINKDDRSNPYERIQHVGGVNPDGTRWRITQPKAIQMIKEGWSFFVEVRGHRVDVVVAESRFGNDYIRTKADQDTPDNLLSLPECPA